MGGLRISYRDDCFAGSRRALDYRRDGEFEADRRARIEDFHCHVSDRADEGKPHERALHAPRSGWPAAFTAHDLIVRVIASRVPVGFDSPLAESLREGSCASQA